MDVTGAEALRKRIEKQVAKQASAGEQEPRSEAQSAPEPAVEPEPPSHPEKRRGERRRSSGEVRPVLKSWLEPSERGIVEGQSADPFVDDEPNGGGAGALNRRLAERRGRYTTVSARRPIQHDASASVLSPDPPATAPPAIPAAWEEPDVPAAATRRPLAPRETSAGVRSRRPHLPTVAVSVGLSIAAALATAATVATLGGSSTSAPLVAAPAAAAAGAPAPAPAAPTTHLHGVGSYNPYGTGPEHDDLAPRATDHNLATFWSTETYTNNGFQKPGTGLVLESTSEAAIANLALETDTPGFQAQIRVSDSPDGGFRADSSWQTVSSRSVFALKGKTGRYWMVWLRLPTHVGVAHINQVALVS